jgi:hypothetical protein
MSPYISVAMQVIGFLVENKDQIKQVVQSIEKLIPDAPGSDKAASVRAFIGKALDVEAQIEAAWPLVAPFFNLFVSVVKGKTTAPAAPVATGN